MRILLLAFLFCSYSIANAQTLTTINKPVVCFPVATLLDALTNTYKEEPVIIGKHGLYKDTITAVYVNTTAGTYTVVEMDKIIGCVVSIGSEFQFRVPQTKSELVL